MVWIARLLNSGSDIAFALVFLYIIFGKRLSHYITVPIALISFFLSSGATYFLFQAGAKAGWTSDGPGGLLVILGIGVFGFIAFISLLAALTGIALSWVPSGFEPGLTPELSNASLDDSTPASIWIRFAIAIFLDLTLIGLIDRAYLDGFTRSNLLDINIIRPVNLVVVCAIPIIYFLFSYFVAGTTLGLRYFGLVFDQNGQGLFGRELKSVAPIELKLTQHLIFAASMILIGTSFFSELSRDVKEKKIRTESKETREAELNAKKNLFAKAILDNKPEEVTEFLQMGLSVDAPLGTANGNLTPLRLALSKGKPEIATLLIQEGATVKDDDVAAALNSNDAPLIRLVLSKNTNFPRNCGACAASAAFYRDMELTTYVLNRLAAASDSPKNIYQRALVALMSSYQTADKPFTDVYDLLVANGADPAALIDGKLLLYSDFTSLGAASLQTAFSKIQFLHSKNVSLSTQDSDGNTYLHFAALHRVDPSQKEKYDLYSELINYGLNPELPNAKGHTPAKIREQANR